MRRELLPEESWEWMLFISREEWQLVFSLSAAMQHVGRTGRDASLMDSLLAAVGFLHEECNYRFRGLIYEEGKLIATRLKPVEEGNISWVLQLKMVLAGQAPPPDYSVHVPVALDYARSRVQKGPGREELLSMLHDFATFVADTVAIMKQKRPTEEERRILLQHAEEMRERRDAAMKQVVN